MSSPENKKFFVPKNLRWVVLAGALVTMGVTMPSCPGQQAMQDQIDQLKQSQVELSKRLQNDESQMKQLADTVNQVKTDSQGMGGMVTQMKGDLDALRGTVQAMDAKLAAAAKPGKAPAKGRKH